MALTPGSQLDDERLDRVLRTLASPAAAPDLAARTMAAIASDVAPRRASWWMVPATLAGVAAVAILVAVLTIGRNGDAPVWPAPAGAAPSLTVAASVPALPVPAGVDAGIHVTRTASRAVRHDRPIRGAAPAAWEHALPPLDRDAPLVIAGLDAAPIDTSDRIRIERLSVSALEIARLER